MLSMAPMFHPLIAPEGVGSDRDTVPHTNVPNWVEDGMLESQGVVELFLPLDVPKQTISDHLIIPVFDVPFNDTISWILIECHLHSERCDEDTALNTHTILYRADYAFVHILQVLVAVGLSDVPPFHTPNAHRSTVWKHILGKVIGVHFVGLNQPAGHPYHVEVRW